MRLRQEMLEQTNKLQDKALRGAKLAQGLQMSTMFKMAVSEFYQTQGHFPESNQEARLQPPTDFTSGALAAAEIRKNGVITLTYTAETGVDGGEVHLIPNERAFGLGWSCESPDYKDINQLISSCTYAR